MGCHVRIEDNKALTRSRIANLSEFLVYHASNHSFRSEIVVDFIWTKSGTYRIIQDNIGHSY